MNKSEALTIIKNILKRVAPKATVILFGSQARGDARPDSDFDLLILEDSDTISYERRREITEPLYSLYYKQGIDVQPIVQTKKEWESRPFKTPFYCNIINDGILL